MLVVLSDTGDPLVVLRDTGDRLVILFDTGDRLVILVDTGVSAVSSDGEAFVFFLGGDPAAVFRETCEGVLPVDCLDSGDSLFSNLEIPTKVLGFVKNSIQFIATTVNVIEIAYSL